MAKVLGTTRSKKTMKYAKHIGISIAHSFYKDFMLNPNWRGPKFDWNTFHESLLRQGGWGSFPYECEEEVYEFVGKTASEEFKRLVQVFGTNENDNRYLDIIRDPGYKRITTGRNFKYIYNYPFDETRMHDLS